jgi:hypothetical protein
MNVSLQTQNIKKLAQTQVFKFNGYIVFLRNDGIAQIQFDKGFEGGLQDAQNMVECIAKLSPHKKIPIIVIYSDFNFFDNEARSFVASDLVSQTVAADALVINSSGLKILGNIYLRINKPQRPTKIFTDLDLALEWVKQFVV